MTKTLCLAKLSDTMSDPITEATDTPGPPQEQRLGVPRWVKIVVMVGVLLVLTAVGLALAGGDHSPGRHLGGDDASPAHTAPPEGGGHTPPPGARD